MRDAPGGWRDRRDQTEAGGSRREPGGTKFRLRTGESKRRRSGLPLRQRRVRLVLVGCLDFDADTVLQGELVANEHIPLSLSCSGHEEDAWFLAGRDEAMSDARRAVHEVPSLEAVLLTFDDRDALTGEDEEVLLVVELAVVLGTALAGLEYGEVIPELREAVLIVLEHAHIAHRCACHPRQIADVGDERRIHSPMIGTQGRLRSLIPVERPRGDLVDAQRSRHIVS